MKISRLFWLVLNKERHVSFAGKKHALSCRRFKRMPMSPQEFIDRNGVACGNCGDLMLPGAKLWLFRPPGPEALSKPGVLVYKGEGGEWLVGCLAWGCIPTAALMCGTLKADRKIAFFESPMEQALRTNEPVIVPDIGSYGEKS